MILSGTASDGTAGLRAIKGEGGITFVQETQLGPGLDGMPRSGALRQARWIRLRSPEEISNT